MQNMLLLLALSFFLSTQQACACEQASKVKTSEYDQVATDQLKKILGHVYRSIWQTECAKIKSLIELRADPNVQTRFGTRLLHHAARRSDAAMVEFCLQQGGCAHVLPGDLAAPLIEARSPEVAQLLLDNKASIDCSKYGNNALHTALALNETSADFLAFWVNTGIDPQAKGRFGKSYLHTLCLQTNRHRYLERIAIGSFLQADAQIKNTAGETAVDELKRGYPHLVGPVEEVISTTQRFKRQLLYEQEQVAPLVSAHMPQTLTPLVIGYAGLEKVLWKKDHWSRIQKSLTLIPITEQENNKRKRLLSDI